MSWLSKVSVTMLAEDYENLKEIYQSLDDKSSLNLFQKGKVIRKTSENVATVTVMWNWIVFGIEEEDSWGAILMDFFKGVYDGDKAKPYKIIVIDEHSEKTFENDEEEDSRGRYLPNETIPYVIKDFIL